MKVYNVYKKIGETPLEALEKFRKKKKIASSARLTYAGRLDPMASGVLLILQDATQKDREKYMALDKEYKVEVLFGFETDSFDLLGIPVFSSPPGEEGVGGGRTIEIKKVLKSYHGKIKLPIPAYSSVPYKGKPLFEWARAGKIKNKDLPVREMNIIRLRQGFGGPSESVSWITSKALMKHIERNIKKVKGDFRQEKILKGWEKILCHPGIFQGNEKYPGSRILANWILPDIARSRRNSGMTTQKYPYFAKASKGWPISNILISCSSGTYIRSIAHDLGRKLGTGGVVYSLERTKVGKYRVK